MRSTLRALLGAAVGLAGILVPLVGPVPQALAVASPKVVIIVGPVAGTTSSYRSDADKAAAAALRYTPNVVKLYSPNATWDVVRPALQGASVVIYMGHGNGFPSPYTTTLQPDRQDGLGLNPTAGVDDSATKYWGEQYMASDVKLAPNAVVLLGHLCYASGSSEPGKAEPTLTQGKQRVDNFAAGFLAAGARAVIAEAYGGSSAAYVDALFTAHTTVGTIWANSFSKQGNSFAFPSTRTPGMTALMDPDHSSGKYYRAYVGDPNLQSDAVVGSVPATDPTQNPSSGAPSPTPADPSPTPPPSAVIGSPTPTPTPTPTGDESKVDLTSAGMSLMSISAPAAFSPNGDGSQDAFPIRARLSAPATWQLTITDASGGVRASVGGLGDTIDLAWDGKPNGTPVPDGLYTYRLSASDGLGGAIDRTARLRVDTTVPLIGATGATSSGAAFSPNGDGSSDTWTGTFTTSEAVSLDATVQSGDGSIVRHLSASSSGGVAKVSWDGRSDVGTGVADGQYVMTLRARDAAGNLANPVVVAVPVYRALSKVTASSAVFYPQDRDAYARTTTLGFVLLAPAAVTWTILDAHGSTVATKYVLTPLPAGPQSWTWDGMGGGGRLVTPGAYTAVATATGGSLTVTNRTSITVAAFQTTASPNPARRGQSITVTTVSAEPLSAAPKLTIGQPGVASRTLTMVRSATNTYRITTRLSSGGSVGTLTLKVTGTDAAKGINTATTTLALK